MTDETGIEIDDTTPMIDDETEAEFRKLIHDYCDILVSPEHRKLQEFGRGCIWGAVVLLDAQGYGDWARSTVLAEIEDYSRNLKSGNKGFFGYLESKGFDARTRRLLIPGNSMQSRMGG